MTRLHHIIFILSFFVFINSLPAQPPPNFDPRGHIYYQGEVLYNKHGTNPTVADWDNDSDKDLVVGFHYEGRVHVYVNSGEFSTEFNADFIPLMADSEMIIFAEYT